MAFIQEKKKIKKSQLQVLAERYYLLITFFIMLIILGLGYYFVLEPKYLEIKAGGRFSLETAQQKLEDYKNYSNNLNQVISNYQKIDSQQLAKIKAILPTDKEVADLFIQMQNLGGRHNFLISDISLNDVTDTAKNAGSKVKKMEVTLNLAAKSGTGYQSLKELLSDLEYNLRLFDVNAVHFNPQSAAYSVSLYTYYNKND